MLIRTLFLVFCKSEKKACVPDASLVWLPDRTQ